MKNSVFVFLMIAAMGFSTQSFGQINSLYNGDSSIVASVYGGLLSSVNFSTDSLSAISAYDLRVGATADWNIADWATIKTFATYDRADGEECALNAFSLKLYKNNWDLEFGHTGTTASEIRPLPPTAAGHFETWTEAQMPGLAINAKVGYKTSFGKIKVGVAARDRNPEYSFHLSTKVKGNPFDIVGVLGGEKESNYLVGATYKSKNTYNVIAFKQCFNPETLIDEQITGYFLNYNLSEKGKLDLYLDAGYNLTAEEIPRLEAGFIKNFESKLIKGLIAIGYSDEIKAYLVIHI